MRPPRSRLFRGDTLLGQVAALTPAKATGWLEGTLEPTPEWTAVASLFQTAAEALRYADRFPDAWDEAFAASQGPGMVLEDESGQRRPVEVRAEGLIIQVQLR